MVKGNKIKLTIDDAFKEKCDENNLHVDYKNIIKVVSEGSRVYVDDGLISLVVKQIGDKMQNSYFLVSSINFVFKNHRI